MNPVFPSAQWPMFFRIPNQCMAICSLVFLLTSDTLNAQSPSSFRIEHNDPGAKLKPNSIQRINVDQYRITGILTSPDSNYFWRSDISSNGTMTNNIKLPLAVNPITTQVILNTVDGGHLFSYGLSSKVFIKTNASGNVEWSTVFPNNIGLFFQDSDHSMVEKDGGYFAFGHDQVVAPNTGWACTLLQLDSVGSCVGTITFNEGDLWSEAARHLIHTNTNGLVTVSLQRPYYTQLNRPQIAVQRWDAALNLEWSIQYSFGYNHSLTSVTELANGDLFMTGTVLETSTSTEAYSFLLRTDTTGQIVWAKQVLDGDLVIQDVIEETNGTLAVLFNRNFPGIAQLDSVGMFLAGVEMDQMPMGIWADEMLQDAINGNYVTLCRPEIITNEMVVFSLDTVLEGTCTGTTLQWPDTLILPAMVNLPTTVSYSTLTFADSSATSGPTQLFVTPLCLSTGTTQWSDVSGLRLWPNPATGLVNIQCNVTMDHRGNEWVCELTIMDVTGRNVLCQSVSANGQRLDLSDLRKGIYIVSLETEHGRYSERLLLE